MEGIDVLSAILHSVRIFVELLSLLVTQQRKWYHHLQMLITTIQSFILYKIKYHIQYIRTGIIEASHRFLQLPVPIILVRLNKGSCHERSGRGR